MKTKTVQARKQRRRVAKMALHQKHKLLSVTLSKELRKKFNRRNIAVRKGDKVTVMTGTFKGLVGEIMNIDLDAKKVYVDKVVSKKRDGTEVLRAIQPSNLMITDLDIRDKERQDVLSRKVEKSVVDAEVKKEEARLAKAEEERKAKEAEQKAKEAEKKAEKEAKEEKKEEKKASTKKTTTKKKVSEKGIDSKTKKDWISEK
jgi:large subunit ribosomal protein L24